MEDTLQKIQHLSRSHALEAAKYVASIIADEAILPTSEIADILGDLSEHTDEVEDLSRVILINAALQPQYTEIVETAIDNTGKKKLILGGAEIVALAAIVLAALKILVNPKSSEEFEYSDKEGKKVKHKVNYNNDTGFVTKVLAKYFKI